MGEARRRRGGGLTSGGRKVFRKVGRLGIGWGCGDPRGPGIKPGIRKSEGHKLEKGEMGYRDTNSKLLSWLEEGRTEGAK